MLSSSRIRVQGFNSTHPPTSPFVRSRVMKAVMIPAPRLSRSVPTRVLIRVLFPDFTEPTTAIRSRGSRSDRCTRSRCVRQREARFPSTMPGASNSRINSSRVSTRC